MRRPHQKLVRRGAAEGGPEGTTHHSPPPHLPFSTYLPSNSCSNSNILSESKSQSEISHAICVPFFLKKKGAPSDSTWPSSRDPKPRSTFDDPPDFRIFVSKGSV